MNNKKPRDPLYPRGFEETREFKKQIPNNYPKPNKKDDELTPLKKLNHKIGVYLNPSSVEITDSEKKKKIAHRTLNVRGHKKRRPDCSKPSVFYHLMLLCFSEL